MPGPIPVPPGYQDEGDYLVHLAEEGRLTPETFTRIGELRAEGWVYPHRNRWSERSYVHHPYRPPLAGSTATD